MKKIMLMLTLALMVLAGCSGSTTRSNVSTKSYEEVNDDGQWVQIIETNDNGKISKQEKLTGKNVFPQKGMKIDAGMGKKFTFDGFFYDSDLALVVQADGTAIDSNGNVIKAKRKVPKKTQGTTLSTAKTQADLKKQTETNTKRIEEVSKENRQGISLATAMSQINPMGIKSGKVGLGAGIGYFKGETSVAVGVGYGVSENVNVSSKGAVSIGDFSTFSIGAGVNVEF